ncbi:AfsR/SARP family transcriptional regulator, partial [Actinocorallia lasiicapitis]
VAALRTYASRLRALLEPDRSAPAVLVSVADGYALRVPVDAVDVHRFERLVAEASRTPDRAEALLDEALALWQGPALSGVPGRFVEIERTRLSERRLAALETRLELALDGGDNARAAAELAVLITEHPLRERFHALLMLALYRSGRQADALAAFQRLRTDLADELGLDPSPALAELHQRMLEADPALTVAVSSPAAAPGGPARPFQLPADIEDFTGRARQTSQIGALLHGDGMPVAVTPAPRPPARNPG